MKVGNATSNKGQIPRFFRALRDILPADGLLVSDEEQDVLLGHTAFR